MNNRIKTVWARRPRLSRGWKLARNLALAVLLVLGYWFATGCVPLTEEAALRRLERTLLLGPGVTLYKETDGIYGWTDLVFVLGEDYAYTGTVSDWERGLGLYGKGAALSQGVRLEDGPVLMPLYGSGWLAGEQDREVRLFPPGPEGAVRAELTLNSRECLDEVAFRAEAEPDEQGVYRFTVRAGTPEEIVLLRELMDKRPDELEPGWVEYWMGFYRADGTPSGAVRGELGL